MQTDWLLGLAGGFIIGLAAALYLLLNGRVMGASGILGGIVDRSGWTDGPERLSFLAGLIVVPGVAGILAGAQTNITGNVIVLVVAGFLVGIGSRLARGCTSGHGVCGISRLSLRGIVATVFYILAGGIVIAVFRHGLGVI